MISCVEIARRTAVEFCLDFLANPYLCYTEHGQHALFYTMLYNALPPENRYLTWRGQKVCALQKEYPTYRDLGKPKRQHWDVALIKDPPESRVQTEALSYDYLRLDAVFEFGLNEAQEHLIDDIERLCHLDSNADHGFLIHLYRISRGGSLFSHRDWSANSARVVSPEHIAILAQNSPVEIYYAIADSTGRYPSAAYRIAQGEIIPLEAKTSGYPDRSNRGPLP